MSLPPEIRVTIEKIGEKQYLSHVETGDGREILPPHTFEYDPGLLVNIEAQRWLEADAQRESGKEPEWLAEYGRKLYGYLFGEGRELASYLKGWPEANEGWRLTLMLHPNAVALWGLPWEYLHDGRRPLALSNVWIQRVPRGLGTIKAQETPLPLRILVVVSSPLDQADLDTEKEIALTLSPLQRGECQGGLHPGHWRHRQERTGGQSVGPAGCQGGRCAGGEVQRDIAPSRHLGQGSQLLAGTGCAWPRRGSGALAGQRKAHGRPRPPSRADGRHTALLAGV